MRPFATRMMCPMTTTGHPSTEPHEDSHGLGARLSAIAGDGASSCARLGLGTAGRERGRAPRRSAPPARAPWSAEPLADGRRLPSRLQLAEKAATEIAPGDRVLVT